MDELLAQWLADPIAIRILAAIIGLIIIGLISRAIRTAITRYINVADTRYRLRKLSSLAGYIIVILMLIFIFGDRIGNLEVTMGVAGAGIAFALQEVIASFAGWFAITFAGLYKPGDRVQLGGITGMSFISAFSGPR